MVFYPHQKIRPKIDKFPYLSFMLCFNTRFFRNFGWASNVASCILVYSTIFCMIFSEKNAWNTLSTVAFFCKRICTLLFPAKGCLVDCCIANSSLQTPFQLVWISESSHSFIWKLLVAQQMNYLLHCIIQ